jgi:hypothetical protein
MDLSRRAFLGSPAVLAMNRIQVSVACALEESRAAFAGLSPCREEPDSGRVIVESAVGFAEQNLNWLAGQGIALSAPIVVRGPAWIRFTWPVPALIRDFGRICRVTGGRAIAHLDGIPVAVRCRNTIVLGTPIGPLLYAGDRDARRLLGDLLDRCDYGFFC